MVMLMQNASELGRCSCDQVQISLLLFLLCIDNFVTNCEPTNTERE